MSCIKINWKRYFGIQFPQDSIKQANVRSSVFDSASNLILRNISILSRNENYPLASRSYSRARILISIIPQALKKKKKTEKGDLEAPFPLTQRMKVKVMVNLAKTSFRLIDFAAGFASQDSGDPIN